MTTSIPVTGWSDLDGIWDNSDPTDIALAVASLADGVRDVLEAKSPTIAIQNFRPADSAELANLSSTYTLQAGDTAYQVDTGVTYRWNGSAWLGAWTAATLAAGWSAPSNYLAPAFRLVNGWCELRGTGQYSATIPASVLSFLSGLPAPASTDNSSVWLAGPSNAATMIYLNPRIDGVMRARSAATGAAGTDYVHLHGLRYWVG